MSERLVREGDGVAVGCLLGVLFWIVVCIVCVAIVVVARS